MNLIKLIENQADRITSYCLILFIFIIFCAVSVFYVNAAEIHGGMEWEESDFREAFGKEEEKYFWEAFGKEEEKYFWEAFDKEEDYLPVSMTGTNPVTTQLQDRKRIRMANEDGIQVAQAHPVESVISEKEYSILTRIVEAEAGTLDQKSKILVANVILNRMNHEEFPDTVEEVVFQKVNGAVQFSPVADGRYYTVKVAESTKESVDRALAGEDYSKGALYFMERSLSAASNVEWFDNCLTKLFKYESHEFYK